MSPDDVVLLEHAFADCKHPYAKPERGAWCNVCGALFIQFNSGEAVWAKPHWRDILEQVTTRRVRLFVWRNLKALADWQDGLCVAAARSKEEAIDAIMRWDPEDGDPKIASRLRDELEATEPQEYDAPHGLHVWGSS